MGDTDPETGTTYTGPSAAAQLTRGERIVVDEAGMLDQDTALALLTVADEHGATLALVGDRAQLSAVGRGGVLDIAAQLSPRVFDMTTVHRFTDSEYSQLTVRMRRGEHPALLFDRLHALGLVMLHEDFDMVQETIARSARDGDAITVATNDEAQGLNARIRDERVRAGLVDGHHTTTGSDGLPLGRGDVIQTRRNDANIQVANRQTWTVQSIEDDGAVWAKEKDTARKRQRTVRLPAEYVTEHTHLAYASTAYGVQGATVPESHTVLSDALDSAGVYVGMTRGRDANRLHIVAANLDDAREQFTVALERDRADRGLFAATQAAHDAVAGLTADGPVRVVNVERARLTKQIERANREAAKWERAGAALDSQAQEQRAEADAQQAIVVAAEANAQRVRTAVSAPLIEQATADGTAYLAVRIRVWAASDAYRTASGLHRRSAARALSAATDEHRTIETAARRRWNALPQTTLGVEPWAASVAEQDTDADPRVIETRERAADARQERQRLTARHVQERKGLRRQMVGDRASGSVQAQVARWRARAEAAHRDLAMIEALPPAEAAQLVRARARARAEQEQAHRDAVEFDPAVHQARAAQLHHFSRRPHDHGPTPPDRGLGL